MSAMPEPDAIALKEATGGRTPLSFDKGDRSETLAPALALQHAGATVGQEAMQWYDDGQNETVANATLQATKDTMDLEKKLRDDPDYKNHVSTFEAAAKEIRERNAEAITNPLKRATFLQNMQLHALQRADTIDKQARATDVSHSRAALNAQIDQARSMLSEPDLLSPEQREKLIEDTGKSIAGLAARPGYLDTEAAHDMYQNFRAGLAEDDVMRAARAGDPAAAKAALDANHQYIPEHKRWTLEDHMQTVAAKQVKLAEADLDQRREAALDEIARTGTTATHPDPAELVRWKGANAPAEYAADMAVATQKYAARSQFTSMSNSDIDRWVENHKPEEGMIKGTKEGDLYTWAKGFASQTKAARGADVARAFDGVDYVQSARKSGDPDAIMKARIKAQTVAGIPEDAQSPITQVDAKELMKEVHSAPNKTEAFKSVVRRLESKYGPEMAVSIMRSAVRFEYPDRAQDDLTSAAVSEIMRLGSVSPGTAQRVQTHGGIQAAESVYGKTAVDYERMAPEAAEKLRAEPKLADAYIRTYGARQVREALEYKSPWQRVKGVFVSEPTTPKDQSQYRAPDSGPAWEYSKNQGEEFDPEDVKDLHARKMGAQEFDNKYGKDAYKKVWGH
jgi:hypothetical protein